MAGEIPLILSLDNHGVPHRWVSWQQACFYYAKNLVAWTMGERTFTFHGGISRMTGERSSITATLDHRHQGQGAGGQGLPPGAAAQQPRAVPPRPPHLRVLRRRVQLLAPDARPHHAAVARRARHLDERGHRLPPVQRQKRNRMPEEAGIELLYAPYVPNKAEYLILTNRRILVRPDGVPAGSTWRRAHVDLVADAASAFEPRLPDFWRNSGFHLLERDPARAPARHRRLPARVLPEAGGPSGRGILRRRGRACTPR